MMDILIVILFLVIICIELVNLYAKLSSCSKFSEKNVFIIVPIKKDDYNIEMKIRQIAKKIMWSEEKAETEVILAEIDANDEIIFICTKLCEAYPFMQYCHLNDVSNVISTNYIAN